MFSGRQDPTWLVSDRAAARLKRIWDSLTRHAGAGPDAPALGYRGCWLRDATGREWFAYGGVVTEREGDREERRADPGKAWEQRLISSAPRGVLPPGMHMS